MTRLHTSLETERLPSQQRNLAAKDYLQRTSGPSLHSRLPTEQVAQASGRNSSEQGLGL
jgi:hypothetical protein